MGYYYQRLRDLREDADLKQSEVAQIIQTTANYYGEYESGKRDIPTERMIKLAQFYKVSMDYITGITNDKGGKHQNSEEEQHILNMYNNLTERNKGKAELFIEQLTENQKEQESKAKEKVS